MNKHSRVCANIDLSAVMHNMEAMHQNIDPDTKIMAVFFCESFIILICFCKMSKNPLHKYALLRAMASVS